MEIPIPNNGNLKIDNILLDLNGTLAVGGSLIEGAKERVGKLRDLYKLILLSGNTRGGADQLANDLGILFIETKTGAEKQRVAEDLNPITCAAIGNGLIDLELIEAVHLGIVTIQGEGVHTKTLLAADIVVPSINDALDLFLDRNRLIATLRR
ncbi:hypothetical protein KKF55_01595 [Patescibacteria group bacterium]|nr:hypothetical protein [Patescibacteria group bacterium]